MEQLNASSSFLGLSLTFFFAWACTTVDIKHNLGEEMTIWWRRRRRRRSTSTSMAVSPCFSCNLSMLITLMIISHMIMVANGKSQSSCTLDACRGNVANECCCKAIRDEIVKRSCSSLCTSFRYYGTPHLVSKCHDNWKCVVCKQCRSCQA